MSDEKLETIALAYAKVEKETDGCYSADSLDDLELARPKILAFKAGYLAGQKAERERSKKLVEALSWALDSVCKHEGDSHQDTNRTWCLYCQSWVYKSDIENLKKAEAILKEYEKEGAE